MSCLRWCWDSGAAVVRSRLGALGHRKFRMAARLPCVIYSWAQCVEYCILHLFGGSGFKHTTFSTNEVRVH